MSRLIQVGIRRYLKSKIYTLSLIATVLLAFFYSDAYVDFEMVILQFVIFAMIISWDVCCEYNEGGFKNKLITGYTKKEILMAEIILSVLANLVLMILSAVIFSVINRFMFVVMPVSTIIKCAVTIFLSIITIIIMWVVVSSMIPNKLLSLVLNIVLLMSMYLGSMMLDSELIEPKYVTEYEQEVLNPNYVDGVQRYCYEFIYNVLPTGRFEECNDIVCRYLQYPSDYPFYELAIKMNLFEQKVISKEDNSMMNIGFLYSLGTIVVITGLGCFLFDKKEIK